MAGAAVVLALVAQGLLADRELPVDGALLFLVALVVWVRALALARPVWVEPTFWRASAHLQVAGLASPGHLLPSAGFAVLAWFLLDSASFNLGAVVAWLASLGFLVRAVVEPPRRWLERCRAAVARLLAEGWRPRLTLLHGLLMGVMLFAVFFRVYELPSVPAEMTSDHVEKLLDVRRVMHGERPLYFEGNTGREPLHFYLAAAVAPLAGFNHLALQLVTIGVSVAAVLATYHLGRELLSPHLGLLAAMLMAVSRWDVTLARMGLRFSFSTLFTTLAVLFLFRALRTHQPGQYLLCGVFLGLGLLGYSNFRVVPALVLILFLLAFVLRGALGLAHWRSLLSGMVVTAAGAAAVVLPLARFATARPELFWQRVDSRMGGFEQPLPEAPLAVLLDNLKDALLMFNWRGDVGWVHNLPNVPALDQVTAALFALGVAYLVVRFIREREYWAAALLVALPVLLLPSALSIVHPIENPSFNRASAAIPVVFLVAAIVPAIIWRLARQLLPGWRGLLVGGGVVLALLAYATVQNFTVYFGDFARAYRQAVPNSSEIGWVAQGYAAALGGPDRVFILVYPHWVDHRAVGLHMGDVTWDNEVLDPEEVVHHRHLAEGLVYLVHPADDLGLDAVRRAYPQGQLLRYESPQAGKDFLVYLVLDGR